ncbi:MAG: hypothetical protein IIY06_07985 [Proteobacteria bacterium]|mgnify:CR=1 FL=1|jgi:hypothetical protein|nr:hypothetical protein [Pseudomonadota bacterium]
MLHHLFIALPATLAEFSWSNFWRPEYINRWDLHMTTFWVPAILGIIFFVLFFQAFTKKKIFLTIVYLILLAACIFYIGTGEQSAAINALENIVQS